MLQNRIIRLTAENVEEAIDTAVSVLLKGGIVALPTDTLYGISTLLPYSERLYALKRRPPGKPLGIFLPNANAIKLVSKQTISDELAHNLLPGPVTLMFERLPTLPIEFNPGVQNVACRVPSCPIVSEICKKLGEPLAQTSANVSGSPLNPTSVEHFEELISDIDLVLDNGPILSKHEGGSTIVDLSIGKHLYQIVRSGCAETETVKTLTRFGLKEVIE
uniref:Threonylcarbamoyl-AMP synthase n=1 Tax=Caenorhabditis japonica TaxID=281687 RepID=A0A8R1DNZ7_CAEJA